MVIYGPTAESIKHVLATGVVQKKEIDLIIELDGKILPIKIKYQAQDVQARDVPGLIELIQKKESILQGYIATKIPNDLGYIKIDPQREKVILKIPACLLCFYLGQAEFHQRNILLES